MAKGARGGKRSQISLGNSIKKQFIEKGMNSKFKGVRRDAKEGRGNYYYKDSKSVGSRDAQKMNSLIVNEKDGNTLITGILNGKGVFYANKSNDKTIIRLKNKIKKQRDSNRELKGNTEIRTTSTYDRWYKNNRRNFESYFYGSGKNKEGG